MFYSLTKTLNPQIYETQRTISSKNIKKTTTMQIKIKLFKTSNREILKSTQKKDTLNTEEKDKDDS